MGKQDLQQLIIKKPRLHICAQGGDPITGWKPVPLSPLQVAAAFIAGSPSAGAGFIKRQASPPCGGSRRFTGINRLSAPSASARASPRGVGCGTPLAGSALNPLESFGDRGE